MKIDFFVTTKCIFKIENNLINVYWNWIFENNTVLDLEL